MIEFLKPVVIEASGGIGDLIQSAAWINALYSQFSGRIPFVLYSGYPELVPIFLPWLQPRHNRDARKLWQQDRARLPWWIEISDVVHFKRRADVKIPKLFDPFYQHWLDELPAWGPLITDHPRQDNMLAHEAVKMGLNRRTLPFFLMGLEPLPLPSIQVSGVDLGSPFVTVHDGYDWTVPGIKDRSMKQWSLKAWGELTRRIHEHRPDVKIVQLGGPRSRVIPGTDLNMTGKLAFKDSLGFLKSALLHIDGDSGLVHARHLFAHRPSLVLWGPTDPRYYGYENNVNLKPKTCGNCWWTKETWMAKCVLGYSEPLCIDSIQPDDVMAAIFDAELL